MGYAQDFMQHNTNLQSIFTAYGGNYQSGNLDPSFKISRLKSDWNTYFKHLKVITISDEDWNREDLSSLSELQNFIVCSGTINNTNDHNQPLKNMPPAVIDNILIQIAAGAGQHILNGNIGIWPGNTFRTSASDAAVALLKSKGWTISIGYTPL